MPGFDVETPNGDSSNGPRFSRDSFRNTRDLPSLLPPRFPVTLKFMDVHVLPSEDREQAKKAQFWFPVSFFFLFSFLPGRILPFMDFLTNLLLYFFPSIQKEYSF